MDVDLKELFKKANNQADNFIKNIKDSDLSKQSTCSQWTVRDLLNHMVSENLWMPELLAGKTIKEVGTKYDGDVLGDNPLIAWEQSSREALGAVEDLQNLNQTTHLSFADVPASEYLNQLILDKLIHGWDVAKSTEQEDSLDPELVEYVWQYASPRQDEFAGYGVFGSKVEVPDDAPLQTKLLGMLGRER